ncbi:MAG: hypothetical protein ABIT72_03885 [Burkholderiaceae bacterium]
MGAGVMAASLDVHVLGGDVTGGLTCCGFVFVGVGLLTLAVRGSGGATSGVGATGKMVRVVNAVLAVLGAEGRIFKDSLAEFKSVR